jgi:ABC-type uncharacterized transport system substrate-binding protein
VNRVQDWFRSGIGFILAVSMGIAAMQPALAHPHVWVTSRSEIVFDRSGQMIGIRHVWVFDAAYSSFMTLGLDSDHDGKPDPDKLADLAKTNVESLSEFGYFTSVKINGSKAVLGKPTEYGLTFADGRLTLRFLVPLEAPAWPKVMALQVDDPSFFVAFTMADGNDAIALDHAPKGCALSVSHPDKTAAEGVQILADDVAAALKGQRIPSADLGSDYTGHIILACP